MTNRMSQSSGVIGSHVHRGNIAALVELASIEVTSRAPDQLQVLADDIARHVAAMAPSSREDLLAQPWVIDTSLTVLAALARADAELVRFVRWRVGDADGQDGPEASAQAIA